MLDLLIRGGQACLPGRGMQPVDIGVEQGRIVFDTTMDAISNDMLRELYEEAPHEQ